MKWPKEKGQKDKQYQKGLVYGV